MNIGNYTPRKLHFVEESNKQEEKSIDLVSDYVSPTKWFDSEKLIKFIKNDNINYVIDFVELSNQLEGGIEENSLRIFESFQNNIKLFDILENDTKIELLSRVPNILFLLMIPKYKDVYRNYVPVHAFDIEGSLKIFQWLEENKLSVCMLAKEAVGVEGENPFHAFLSQIAAIKLVDEKKFAQGCEVIVSAYSLFEENVRSRLLSLGGVHKKAVPHLEPMVQALWLCNKTQDERFFEEFDERTKSFDLQQSEICVSALLHFISKDSVRDLDLFFSERLLQLQNAHMNRIVPRVLEVIKIASACIKRYCCEAIYSVAKYIVQQKEMDQQMQIQLEQWEEESKQLVSIRRTLRNVISKAMQKKIKDHQLILAGLLEVPMTEHKVLHAVYYPREKNTEELLGCSVYKKAHKSGQVDELKYLISSPKSLGVFGAQFRVTGVATTLLDTIGEFCFFARKQPLYRLESSRSAEEFYIKQGFKMVHVRDHNDEDKEYYVMHKHAFVEKQNND